MLLKDFIRVFGSVFVQLKDTYQLQDKKESTEMHFQEQQNFENRIACGICLEPRLRMVTGNCQHRFCVQCIYDGNGLRKIGLEKCPSCQMDSAFPTKKPVIPEDSIEIQRALGVGQCDTCGEEMWLRELGDHESLCTKSPVNKSTRKHRSPNSNGPRHKVPQNQTSISEVKRLLSDLEDGMKTRSRRSPQCLQELDINGRPTRRHRSPPSKVKSQTLVTSESRSPSATHPYRKK